MFFFFFFSLFQSPTQQEVLSALKKRLEQTNVPLFPRHRLRMLSKLAEGAFGSVSFLCVCVLPLLHRHTPVELSMIYCFNTCVQLNTLVMYIFFGDSEIKAQWKSSFSITIPSDCFCCYKQIIFLHNVLFISE